MLNLKKFKVTLVEVEVSRREHVTEIEAESHADAVVLAKYIDVPSYKWNLRPNEPALVQVESIEPAMPVAHYEAMAREAELEARN